MLRTTVLMTAAAMALTAVAGCDQQDPEGAAPQQSEAPTATDAPAETGATPGMDDPGAAPAAAPTPAPTDETTN